LQVEPLLWDITQTAAALGYISTKTVARMAASGELPGRVHIGRRVMFNRKAIREWIDRGCPCVASKRRK
jgi:predicted DNA-binding transcriptional regulator AlpA